MDTFNLGPADPQAGAPAPSRSGRTKRIVTTVAASAVLLGGGAGIGVALTGGASASSGSGSASTGSSGTAATTATTSATASGRCAKITAALQDSDHPRAAARVRAFCHRPLLRLALVGGEYGQVTFKGTTTPRTIAFERGTVESLSGSVLTVQAADGTTWTWVLSSSTKVRSDGQLVGQSQLAGGEQVLVGGPVVSGARDAKLIRIRPSGSSGSSGSSAPSSSSSAAPSSSTPASS
jgi:hypothetical protein